MHVVAVGGEKETVISLWWSGVRPTSDDRRSSGRGAGFMVWRARAGNATSLLVSATLGGITWLRLSPIAACVAFPHGGGTHHYPRVFRGRTARLGRFSVEPMATI